MKSSKFSISWQSARSVLAWWRLLHHWQPQISTFRRRVTIRLWVNILAQTDELSHRPQCPLARLAVKLNLHEERASRDQLGNVECEEWMCNTSSSSSSSPQQLLFTGLWSKRLNCQLLEWSGALADSGGLCLDLGGVWEVQLVWMWRRMLLKGVCVICGHSVDWGRLITNKILRLHADRRSLEVQN